VFVSKASIDGRGSARDLHDVPRIDLHVKPLSCRAQIAWKWSGGKIRCGDDVAHVVYY